MIIGVPPACDKFSTSRLPKTQTNINKRGMPINCFNFMFIDYANLMPSSGDLSRLPKKR